MSEERIPTLIRFIRSIVKVDGAPEAPNWGRIRDSLRDHIKVSLRNGSSLYLPLTSSIEGFPALKVVVKEDAYRVLYELLEGVLEAKARPVPIIGWRLEGKRKKGDLVNTDVRLKILDSLSRCKGEMLQGYLEFSGYIVEYILDYLNRRAWMLGVQEALFSLLTIRGLRDIYLACRNTPYKKLKIEDVFKGVNKVYGNLLVLTGGAIYRPVTPRELHRGWGRNVPYRFIKSPFTGLLLEMVRFNRRDLIGVYLELYKGLMREVSHVLSKQEFKVGDLYSSIGRYLDRVKETYGVHVDEVMIEDMEVSLLDLLKDLGVIRNVSEDTYALSL
ncbi:MAG: hypothetical protein ACO2O2_11605 [Acidilobaceae archaeon]